MLDKECGKLVEEFVCLVCLTAKLVTHVSEKVFDFVRNLVDRSPVWYGTLHRSK